MDSYKIHASFDIFTLLSKKNYEMFPNVIIEALTYKIPFVGTNTTGVPEAAEEGEGFICESHDIECIAQRFSELIENKKLRKEMGEKGRASVEKKFNINAVVNIIENAYKEY